MFPAFSMVNAFWWALNMWYNDLHTLCPLPQLHPSASTLDFHVPNIPVLLFPGPCQMSQVTHHCPWVYAYFCLGLLLCPQKVNDQVYHLKLFPLGWLPLSALTVPHQSGATWAAVHFWLHVPNNPFMRTFPSLSAGHKGLSLANIDMSWGRGTGATVMDDKGSQPPAGAAYLCAQVLVMPRPAILLPSFNGLLVDLPELLT